MSDLERENAELRKIIANQSSLKNQLFSKLISIAAEFARSEYLKLDCEDGDGYLCNCCENLVEYHRQTGIYLKYWYDMTREDDMLEPVRHEDGSYRVPKY